MAESVTNVSEARMEEAEELQEKDFVFDKTVICPVCNKSFTAKIMKTNKAKLLGTDKDLRPRYRGIDAIKYDVVLCTECGYAALGKFFPRVTEMQCRQIRENISGSVQIVQEKGEIYSYDESLMRYRLAMEAAVVKRSKSGERAYLCLKTAWLLRGYQESLGQEEKPDGRKIEELLMQEEEYLQNAYAGFMEAREKESFPICGMDATTVDYLLAVLAMRFERYDIASRLIATILTSPIPGKRVKEKCRDLKDEMLCLLRKEKNKE